jgi:dTDP-glucose 4,6-dehydratase
MEGNSGFGEVFNIGSNFEVSIYETAELIASLMGKNFEICEVTERLRPAKSEVERLWADNRKICNVFGWQPSYSGLSGFKLGLAKTIEWFSNPSNLTMYKSNIYNI